MLEFKKLQERINGTKTLRFKGTVNEIIGLVIHANGPKAGIGELVYIKHKGKRIPAEVVGFKENKTLLMPLGDMSGITPGDVILSTGGSIKVKVGASIVGRVVDGLGQPLDDKV